MIACASVGEIPNSSAIERTLLPAREVVAIVEAELGPDAGLVGAALVAFDALDEG